MMTPAPIPGRPGDVMETVLVGFPIGVALALWHHDGTTSYWETRDAETLMGELGTGVIARSEVSKGRFREVGIFNPQTSVLLLPGRYSNPEESVSASGFTLSHLAPGDAREMAARSEPSVFYDRLGSIAVAAARRGEFVAIETGGWEIPFAPYALALMIRQADGSWQAQVEASPVPRGAPFWTEQPQPQDAEGQAMSFPATDAGISLAGKLAGSAMEALGLALLDLGLSFGPSPFGPWPG